MAILAGQAGRAFAVRREKCLLAEEHPDIREAVAVVVGTEDPDTAHIVAWLAAQAEVTSREIKGCLSTRLPARMRPARISIVSALPRTVTGKVDRVSLANQAWFSSK